MTDPSGTLDGARLLVVEDEAMVAMLVEDMLTDLGGVVVEVAGTVARGLAAAASETSALDAAVLDVNVGGEKVFPVAEALAARGVPFAFATGYGAEGIEARFAAAPVLAKPFTIEALQQVFQKLLQAGPDADARTATT
ncbi:Response regulator [Rhodovastum atsumiense]|uniref:Response regulator n=1 Tax=Rhodovastum atsumiense TaxID=504468 RepID=A0A5M6IS99_9PROT|nr:response regulator [Rhodovastum atsumiense]KAA5611183.1 response regulator [Rhodovastum atsumiense]CAH2602509.1 Response regulator [Rhodovastum atsumiense]